MGDLPPFHEDIFQRVVNVHFPTGTYLVVVANGSNPAAKGRRGGILTYDKIKSNNVPNVLTVFGPETASSFTDFFGEGGYFISTPTRYKFKSADQLPSFGNRPDFMNFFDNTTKTTKYKPITKEIVSGMAMFSQASENIDTTPGSPNFGKHSQPQEILNDTQIFYFNISKMFGSATAKVPLSISFQSTRMGVHRYIRYILYHIEGDPPSNGNQSLATYNVTDLQDVSVLLAKEVNDLKAQVLAGTGRPVDSLVVTNWLLDSDDVVLNEVASTPTSGGGDTLAPLVETIFLVGEPGSEVIEIAPHVFKFDYSDHVLEPYPHFQFGDWFLDAYVWKFENIDKFGKPDPKGTMTMGDFFNAKPDGEFNDGFTIRSVKGAKHISHFEFQGATRASFQLDPKTKLLYGPTIT